MAARAESVPIPIDSRAKDEIDDAACRGVKTPENPSGWYCKRVSGRSIPIAGGGAKIPPGQTVPFWCFDPDDVSGFASDLNACTSCAAPCSTFYEIVVHRWGCLGNPVACPRLAQVTAIEQLSNSDSKTDLIYLYPSIEQNAYLSFFGPLGPSQQVCAGPVIVTATKSRTRGASSLLTVTLPDGCASATAHETIVNAGHPSVAFLNDNTTGTTWTVSQPLARVTPPWTGVDPPEIDTWTTGDTVTVYAPVRSPIVALHATIPNQTNSPGIPNLYVSDVQIKQAVGTASIVTVGPNVTLNEVRATPFIYHDVNQVTDTFLSSVGENGVFGAAWSGYSGPPTWKGGILNNPGSNTMSLVLEAGVIWKGLGHDINAQLNDVYIAAGATLISDGISIGATYPGQPNSFVWGPGTFVVDQGSSFLFNHATATPCLLVSTAQLDFLNGTGCSTNNAAPATVNCGIPVDGPHIDAPFGASGGGGMLWNPSGANILTLNSPF